MADPTNAFTYLGQTQTGSIQTLTGLPSMNATPLVFPPGLGRTDPNTAGNKTIPFTLFMPYKRSKQSLDALRSTITGNNLFTKMPQPEFAIALPTPTSALKTQYGVEYSPFEVGGMVGGLISASDDVRNNLEKLIKNKQWTKEDIETLKIQGGTAAKNLLESAGINLASGLSSLVTSADTVNAFFGVQENPYTEFIFKNVAPRRHSFSYTFMPRTQDESEKIDRIINIFKYTMLPRPTLGSLMFQFPYEFQIIHSTQSTTFTLLPSVLTSCDVDYSGGMESPKFFTSDYPAKITMTMEFQEVVLLNRDRMQKDAQVLAQDNGAPTNALRFRF